MRYLDVNRNRLLIFLKEMNDDFWDSHWLENWDKNFINIYRFNPNSIVCRITPKFLHPTDGPILEGGCGTGKYVYFLSYMNYDVIGVDIAKNILKKVKKKFPKLKFEIADVRQIPFPENYFIGYWSLGVIEHFFNGYMNIIKEMKRVIKPKGFLFISFPYMSLFRRFKVKFKLYKIFNNDFLKKNEEPKKFYQYILNQEEVINDFEKLGFKLIYFKPLAGIKGLKDEIFFLKFYNKKFLQLLYNNQNSKVIALFRVVLEKFLVKFAGHSILLVFQLYS